MARKLVKNLMKKFEQFAHMPVLKPFERHLAHPALWALNRRSVALAVAVGLFCGLIPGPMQVLGAAFMAIGFKFNFPIAVVTTLYTNPLTIIPLYLLAYQLGALLMGVETVPATFPPMLDPYNMLASIRAIGEWGWGLGPPLFLGIPALGLCLAALGYCLVRGIWSMYLRQVWRKRRARRSAV